MQFPKKSCLLVLLCFLISFSTSFPLSLVAASSVGQFTTFLPNNGQFREPYGIAVDAGGNVYIADTNNHRIQKFTSDGTFIKKWGSYGSNDGQFNTPTGIAVDAGGNVYVADYYNDRIQKFTSDGTFLKKWGSYGSNDGQFYQPYGIAVDAGGNVYVADTHNHRIQKFTSDGIFQEKWGSVGTGEGQFNVPVGIVVDAVGNVYVSDFNNHRIQKFTSDGTFQEKWGSVGTNEGQFSNPDGIAVDTVGNVYVVDRWNYRIQKFTSDGTFQEKWGSRGMGNGQFNLPTGIAVDAGGNVYVADTLNNRIQKMLVQQPVSSNVELSGLTVSSGMLSPSFSTTQDTFTLNVGNGISSLDVTATAVDSLAKVEILGMTALGTVTHTIGLNVGSNVIPVVVTAEDGVTTKTYTITVTRAGSSDATLNSLTVSEGTLSPAFASHTDAYTVSVDHTVSLLNVTAIPTDSYATVMVNGNVTTSDTITLTAGQSTTIPILVTAQDGGQKTYTVTVQPASVVIPVTSVALHPSTLSLTAGGSSTILTATVNPANASNQNVIWSSDNPTVASVDTNGVVTPIAAGTATITVMTVDGGKIATSLVWVQEMASGGGSYIPNPTPISTVENMTVNIAGENGHLLTKTLLERRRETNGVIKDRLELSGSIARELIAKATEQGIHTVRFILPNPAEKAVETRIDILKTALLELMNGHMNIEMVTENGVIAIPVTSLESWKDDLYFRIVPVKKEDEKHAIETRAKQDEKIQEMAKAGNGTIEILGFPLTIETNMQNVPVTITLPLPANVTEEQMDHLVIYIEHSDGTKEAVRGRITQMNSTMKGVAFDVNHFSTFNMLYVEGAAEYFASLEQEPVPEETTTEEIQVEETMGTHLPYIQGYSDGTFRPNATVTRAQMAAMLARNLSENAVPNASKLTYKDTNESWAKDDIEFVRAQGIMTGRADSTFGPNDAITRAQMAVIAVRWIDKQCAKNPESMSFCEMDKRLISYSDVKITYWAAKEIERIGQFGIMEGSGDGKFRPNDKLTRAQAVKVLNRLFERGPFEEDSIPMFKDVSTQHWAFKDIQEATLRHTYKIQEGIEYKQ
ncbi:S-layer homology domain-containing protein [Lysinibacillus sp. KU-BSD001]|uniref:S-layer homology domain-containing protein n=1 Tax=Lysinibacillus sp. KU-BSD001 TaxID=3141328 RepID=UPI0036EC459E